MINQLSEHESNDLAYFCIISVWLTWLGIEITPELSTSNANVDGTIDFRNILTESSLGIKITFSFVYRREPKNVLDQYHDVPDFRFGSNEYMWC